MLITWIITWMSNIRDVNQGCMSLSSHHLDYSRHVVQLLRHCAYVPTSNTASHDNHEKINSWVSFCFPLHCCHYQGDRLCTCVKSWPDRGMCLVTSLYILCFFILLKSQTIVESDPHPHVLGCWLQAHHTITIWMC